MYAQEQLVRVYDVGIPEAKMEIPVQYLACQGYLTGNNTNAGYMTCSGNNNNSGTCPNCSLYSNNCGNYTP
jgi:hypothetical protein